ncbi:helix-turn-helix domain-containing protein [Enterococcus sp. 1001283B150225_161107_E12]|uniref:helix-turn-helix domain-containing protein n=1 Tax=Enterococcus sp. 1001283B150225_161107_E12 TaxID=2787145 RepID=UPI00189E4815|nr:helix-turn-helix domain-containing protein [Enterococcus sp. 1001283B150225_161107_E12]
MRDLQLAFISNRVTSRLFKLLSIIERNRLFTIGELAEKIQVTERTIANDLKYMRDYFGESITLMSGNSGFVFEETRPSIYNERKQHLLENECLFEIIGNIFYGKLYRVDELADYYHFSESSFRRMLTQSNSALKSYGLQWVSNPLTIQGDEASLRKFFKDFYYEGIETDYTVLPDPAFQDLILTQLNGKLGNYRIGSGTTPAAHYYTYFIALKRASLGYSINLPEELINLAYTGADFSLMYSLKESLEQLYGNEIPKEEFAWIYLMTIIERTLDCEDQEQLFYDHFHQEQESAQLTEAFLQMHELPQTNRQTVATFMRSFFLSIKLKYLIAPALNKEMTDIKEAVIYSDRETYQKNLHFLKEQGLIAFGLSKYLEDICVSLTLYSGLILDLYSPKKTIYFLLEGDHFICQYIRTRAIQQFGSKHRLTFLPLQSLTSESLQQDGIDLIVTNYSRYVLDFVIETAYLLLKEVPDDQDWYRLEQTIDPYRKKLK